MKHQRGLIDIIVVLAVMLGLAFVYGEVTAGGHKKVGHGKA